MLADADALLRLRLGLFWAYPEAGYSSGTDTIPSASTCMGKPMDMRSVSVAALLATTLLAGCATTQEASDALSAEEQAHANAKQERVSRNLTLAWDNMGRGGAAMRQPAYIHVLGDDSEFDPHLAAKEESEQNQSSTGAEGGRDINNLEVALTALTEIQSGVTATQKGVGYSHYELSRWERFCDGGKGMDERDWRFIEGEGAENAPTSLIGDCSPPQHDYQDYLTAWTKFCTSDDVTSADREIVRNSVRPFSVVNPCEAIQ